MTPVNGLFCGSSKSGKQQSSGDISSGLQEWLPRYIPEVVSVRLFLLRISDSTREPVIFFFMVIPEFLCMPSLLSAPGSIFSIIVREKSVSAGVGSGNQERILVIYIGIEKSKISNNDLSFLFQQKTDSSKILLHEY